MIMSTMLASVAEGMCLSDSLGLDNDALVEVRQGTTTMRSGFAVMALLWYTTLGSVSPPPDWFGVVRFGGQIQ